MISSPFCGEETPASDIIVAIQFVSFMYFYYAGEMSIWVNI